MRWIMYGSSITPAVAAAFERHEHHAVAASACDLPEKPALSEILKVVRARQLELITTESTVVDYVVENGLPAGRCFVYLQLDGADVEQDDAIDRLFKRYRRLTPGRLYTVTGTRVKVRQLPTKF